MVRRASTVWIVTDLLSGLVDLADIGPAFAEARDAVDAALRHPSLRRSGGAVAAEVGLRSAVASAALDNHEYDREAVRDGLVPDPVVQGSLRVSGALDGMVAQWTRVPRQVLARLHVLAARDVVPDGQLGRPALDPAGSVRLDALVDLIAGGTSAPAMLVAAVVHGELLALSPFAGPSGVVARGAARLTLIAGGLDPRGLLAVDVGHLARRPEYLGAAGAFATGTRDGVRSWLKHYAAAITVAAAQLSDISEEVAASGRA